MNTRVFRLDLNKSTDLAGDITLSCNKQLADGYNLVSTFVWQTDLILIFQKL